jgi:hypothetical protein
MPAIITNAFRTYNADNFIKSLEADTAATGDGLGNKIYLLIAKDSPWSGNSIGQYADGSYSDSAVPTPKDTVVAPFIHYNDVIAAKLINVSDVSHVIKRLNWTSGTVYDEYDHEQDDLIDRNYFVMTDQFNVYKCISNNQGVASTDKPTGQGVGIIEGATDKYRWKFMYEVQQADVLKYVTTDWLPVKYLTSSDGTNQWLTQQAAVDGALEHIDVTAGGSGYNYVNTGTAQSTSATTIVLASAAEGTTNDVYNGATVYITNATAGAGQQAIITDYVAATRTATVPTWTTTPTGTVEYQVYPTISISHGSETPAPGTTALARVDAMTGDAIARIAMSNVGAGYRSATITASGGGTNPTHATLSPRIGPVGGHGANPVTELGGAYIMINVRLVGTESGVFETGDDFRKVILLANPLQESNGAAATATRYGPTVANTSGLKHDTGKMIYIEYRMPINRASDQTEDIKLVVEF